MKNKNKAVFVSLFLIFLILLCGCSKVADNEVDYNEKVNRYNYINGLATFSSRFEDGYVIFTDDSYSENEEYYGKVRWADKAGAGSIVEAYQVISVDNKEIYSKELLIETADDDTHTWNHLAKYDGIVKAKCSKNKNPECYIKLIDSNGIEYHAMLTPIEQFNNNGYSGSAVYIINKENNVEFWYDDLMKILE